MRRPTPPGTPSRSSSYLTPSDAGRLVRLSLAAALIVLGVGVGVYGVGFRRVASPGTLAPPHGGIDTQCTQCHQPAKQVVDLRCERCHDPIDSRRFEQPSHAMRIAGHAPAADRRPEMACAACHTDHRARGRELVQVADTQCAACHTFSSLGRHPEFALVKAGRDTGSGLDFSHETHLKEIAKTGGDRCLSCHAQTPDQRAFEPVSFDTHCAKCHIINGALTINGRDPLKSGWTPAAALPPSPPPGTASAPIRGATDERGRVTLEHFSHRDAWTEAAAARLGRAVVGESVAAAVAQRAVAERAERRVRLDALTRPVPLTALADADLAAWQQSIDGDLASLQRAAAGGSGARPDPAAGLESLAAIDPSMPALMAQLRAAAANAGSTGQNAADPRTLDERRQEVARLIAALSQRATGADAAKVADLQKRLAAIGASAAAAPLDAAAIGDRLDAVEAALAAVEPGAGPSAVAAARAWTDLVRQQPASGGSGPDSFATRARILDLLRALEPRANLAMRARIADLRDTATAGDNLQRVHDRQTRLRDRIVLERALRAEHGPATVDVRVNRERAMADRELQVVKSHDGAQPAAPPLPPVDLESARAKTALKGLLAACTPCHRLDEDEAAIRPIAATRSILTAAVFSHKPHTNQATCDSCHKVATSRAGTDVNLPAVTSCATCHDASRARADCVSCHTYHPQSAAELVVASR